MFHSIKILFNLFRNNNNSNSNSSNIITINCNQIEGVLEVLNKNIKFIYNKKLYDFIKENYNGILTL